MAVGFLLSRLLTVALLVALPALALPALALWLLLPALTYTRPRGLRTLTKFTLD